MEPLVLLVPLAYSYYKEDAFRLALTHFMEIKMQIHVNHVTNNVQFVLDLPIKNVVNVQKLTYSVEQAVNLDVLMVNSFSLEPVNYAHNNAQNALL